MNLSKPEADIKPITTLFNKAMGLNTQYVKLKLREEAALKKQTKMLNSFYLKTRV